MLCVCDWFDLHELQMGFWTLHCRGTVAAGSVACSRVQLVFFLALSAAEFVIRMMSIQICDDIRSLISGC